MHCKCPSLMFPCLFSFQCVIVTNTPRWESNVSRQHYINLVFADQTTRAQNAKSARKVILRRPSVFVSAFEILDLVTWSKNWVHLIQLSPFSKKSGEVF